MIIEGQYVKDGAYILWAWSLLEEQRETTESTEEAIENMCLSCETINVDEKQHQCSGRQVA